MQNRLPPLHQAAPRSLYVHIPFCASKCWYCDFNSYVQSDAAKTRYTTALLRELALLAEEYQTSGDRLRLDTVFFGGGTPTELPLCEWERIAMGLREQFAIDESVEWTVEANPGSKSDHLLAALALLGVNRVSFGAQAFEDDLLKAIGRRHDTSAIEQSVALAMSAGFSRINLDLMIGLPEQTLANVQESVRKAIDLGVTHVSVYGLKVEPGTVFARRQAKGCLPLPDEDLEARMFEEARARLAAVGIEQYEISNFAKSGAKAHHNLAYWRNRPYLAAGAGAHGYVYGMRYENVKSLSLYEESLTNERRPLANTRAVSAQEAMEDSVILGLRLREGVQKAAFAADHGVDMGAVFGDVIRPLVECGWLLEDAASYRLPVALLPVANEIMLRFLRE